MLIITDPKEAYHQVQAWKRQGLSVGLVPTMGFLHEGHMSLVAASQTRCERTVVSIFVNPTQFRPEEDLSSYPRDEERDRTMLEQAGVDLLFLPSVEAMYPRGFASSVEVRGLSEKLAGAHRPGHFHGVTTYRYVSDRPGARRSGQKFEERVSFARRAGSGGRAL